LRQEAAEKDDEIADLLELQNGAPSVAATQGGFKKSPGANTNASPNKNNSGPGRGPGGNGNSNNVSPAKSNDLVLSH
jgi:hypothetical protein